MLEMHAIPLRDRIISAIILAWKFFIRNLILHAIFRRQMKTFCRWMRRWLFCPGRWGSAARLSYGGQGKVGSPPFSLFPTVAGFSGVTTFCDCLSLGVRPVVVLRIGRCRGWRSCDG